MRTSNKVLLVAVAALLALFISFVLVMGFTARELVRRRGTTALVVPTSLEARPEAAPPVAHCPPSSKPTV